MQHKGHNLSYLILSTPCNIHHYDNGERGQKMRKADYMKDSYTMKMNQLNILRGIYSKTL